MLLLSLQGTGGRTPGAHLQAFPSRSASFGGVGAPAVPQERLPTPRGAKGGTANSHTGSQASRHLLETAGTFPFSTPEGGALRPLLNLGFNLPGASLRAYLWDSGRSQPRMAPKPGPVMPFSDLHTGKQATGPQWQGQGRVQPAHRTKYTGKAGRGHGPWTRSLSSRSSSRNASWDQRGGLGARPLKKENHHSQGVKGWSVAMGPGHVSSSPGQPVLSTSSSQQGR